MTIAFLFPGQGSQAVGMSKAFHDTSAGAKAVFEEANAALGFDLARLVFEGPEAELALTANTQPAVLTASVAAAAACAERGLRPAFTAGHSLGEYTALVVAGALRFADAVRIVRKRGELMQEAVPVGTGAMAAIMGLEVPAVEKICADAGQGDVVEVANVNSPMQVVIAGHRAAVERGVGLAKERGGRMSVLLPVSAPFHCSLMAPAGARLAGELDAVPVTDPTLPVVRNVDAGVTRTAADVRPFLLRQVASPVRWTDCVRRLAAEGAATFVEVGPGRVLTGLMRRILDDARGLSVEDPEGLEKALASVGGAAVAAPEAKRR
jgi:[acyl-carrier-protein] S-malonyltransferase